MDIEKKSDSMRLLNNIKNLIHGWRNDLPKRHNKPMAHTNLVKLHQECFQEIQDCRDQYMSMRKVFYLELRFIRYKRDTTTVLLKKGRQTQAKQLSEAVDQV